MMVTAAASKNIADITELINTGAVAVAILSFIDVRTLPVLEP